MSNQDRNDARTATVTAITSGARRHLTVVTGDACDQVPRLRRYRAEHPRVTVLPPHAITGGRWEAYADGDRIAAENELADFLDVLEG